MIKSIILTNLIPLIFTLINVLCSKIFVGRKIVLDKIYIPEIKYANLTSSIMIVFDI